MLSNFNIDTTTISLFFASILCVIILLLGYCRRIYSLPRNQKKQISNKQPTTPTTPVSIIIYCNNNTEQLKALLPQVLNQNYSAPFEVIVVNDGEDEDTKDIIKQFSLTHKNLHTTFTPKNARNVSRKKLSLTLGIKSAKHEIVVLTNAFTHINSSEWLTYLTSPLNNGKDISIGIASPDTTIDTSKGRYRRAFDDTLDSTKYLTSAMLGRVYKADSSNLAYRKQLFFNNKGFSHSLNLQYGDDDIFISEISTPDNTEVVLLPDSIITIQHPNYPTIHKELKQRHIFTSKHIKKYNRTKYSFGLYSFTFWLWVIISTATIIHNPTSILHISCVTTSTALLWTPTIIAWRKALQALHSRNLSYQIPYFILTQPFYNFIYRLKANKTKNRNFTWH